MTLPRLRELRKARGLSQLKVAMDLHMSQNSISRYETGEHEPGLKELITLADYYGVSVDYLLGRSEDPLLHP